MRQTDIQHKISGGESATLEFKKSTAQLNRVDETLCAFLNSDGGTVIVGVTAEGKIVGQEVTDKARREIAAMLDRFEPPPLVEIQYVGLPKGRRKLIVLEARLQGQAWPFTFDGRPYQRVETTTSVMPQERFEALLLERAHVRRRWENQPAVDVRLEDLDHEEILRTRAAAIEQRHRSPAPTSRYCGIRSSPRPSIERAPSRSGDAARTGSSRSASATAPSRRRSRR